MTQGVESVSIMNASLKIPFPALATPAVTSPKEIPLYEVHNWYSTQQACAALLMQDFILECNKRHINQALAKLRSKI